MPAKKARSPAPGRRSGAPSGGGTGTSMKRRQAEELLELPPLSSLPDGDIEHFIGGWSALEHVATSLTAITHKINAAASSPAIPEGTDASAAPSVASCLTTDQEEVFISAAGSSFEAAVQGDRSTLRRLLEAEDAVVKGKISTGNNPSGKSNSRQEDREEDDLQRASGDAQHYVVILPRAGDQQQEGDDDESGVHVALVTHGLTITGLLPSQSTDRFQAFEGRIQATSGGGRKGAASPTTEDEEGAEHRDDDGSNDEDEEDINRPPYTVKFRAADAKDDDDDEDAGEDEDEDEGGDEDEEGGGSSGGGVLSDEAIAFVLASKKAALRRARLRGEGRAAVAAAATGKSAPSVARRALVVDPNNTVQVPGPLIFQGLRPRITVPPAEVTPEAIYAAAGLAPPNTGGKAKRRTEEEKAKEAAAEAALVAEAAANAKAEEERLSQFADPSRFPTINVTRLAFVPPQSATTAAPSPLVSITNAHVNFVGCHFTAKSSSQIEPISAAVGSLCAVGAHCRVSFTRCSFVAPRTSAIYAYPSSSVSVTECVFTAAPQPTHFFAGGGDGEEKEGDLSSLERFIFAASKAVAMTAPAKRVAGEQVVGVHADSAKVSIGSSHFEGLDVAVILRGVYKVPVSATDTNDGNVDEGTVYGIAPEANDEGHRVVRPKPAHSIITENTFLANVTAMCFVDARRTAATKNACVGSARYDVQCLGTRCTPQILRCNLQGKVYVEEGSAPFLHSNHMAHVPVNKGASTASTKSVYSPTY